MFGHFLGSARSETKHTSLGPADFVRYPISGTECGCQIGICERRYCEYTSGSGERRAAVLFRSAAEVEGPNDI